MSRDCPPPSPSPFSLPPMLPLASPKPLGLHSPLQERGGDPLHDELLKHNDLNRPGRSGGGRDGGRERERGEDREQRNNVLAR